MESQQQGPELKGSRIYLHTNHQLFIRPSTEKREAYGCTHIRTHTHTYTHTNSGTRTHAHTLARTQHTQTAHFALTLVEINIKLRNITYDISALVI